MHVDDAATMARGGVKLEWAFSRDHQMRGPDLMIGVAPGDDREVNANLARARSSSLTSNDAGMSLKWVPVQTEIG